MSRSYFLLQFQLAMLEGHRECVAPELRDTSGGHTTFKTMMKMRTRGVGSWQVDGIDEPWDREKWKKHLTAQLLEELRINGERYVEVAVDLLLKQAEDHCREHHKWCDDHAGDKACECECHKPNKILIHDHACCSRCMRCGFRSQCTCHNCKQ